MAKRTDSDSGAFLGGGPKFNQAGDNKPMAGEKVSDAVVNPLPFGGPRIWIGTLIVLVLLGTLWMIFGGGLPGTQTVHGHGGASMQDRPGLNPDAPQQP
jgi:hypothetical protein